MPVFAEDTIPRYARWVIRWRWPVIAACLVASLAAVSGVRYLELSVDYRMYFGKDNPQLVAYEALEAVYTQTDNVLFVLQPANRDVFTPESLRVVKRLTEESWQIPHAIRVDSLTNFQHTEADGDQLIVGDLVEDPDTLDAARLAEIRRIALAEPALVNRIVAADAATTGVVVTLQFPGTDHTEHVPQSVRRAKTMAAELRAAHPDMTLALTGLATMSYTVGEITGSDMLSLLPVMLILIVAFMLLLLRSVAATVAVVVVVTLSAATATGMMGWLGIKMSPTTAAAPVIVLTLAIADSVHILMTLFDEMRQGRGRRDALVESLRINAEPVFLTSLTTVIGFLSLNFSDSPPFHHLGNIAAIGVVTAWALSMTCGPALISVLPIRPGRARTGRRLTMDRFGDFVVTRRTELLWGVTAVALLLIAAIPRIEIDDDFVEWFDESVPFRAETDFATANLVGPYTLEFSVGSGEPGGVAEPEYLERLDAFAEWLRAQPDVAQVNSLADIMKRINRSMHGDDPAWHRLPGERELAAQYLLLYEMSLPYGLDLNSSIDVDKSATRLTATMNTVPMGRMREAALAAEDWLAENTPPAMRASATGTSVMFAYLTDRNIRTMLKGTALAFVLIAATLVLALRSVRLGLISLIPNVLPVLISFGLWALVFGRMGIIASVITATSLGLIVDDTVHVLSKYRRAKHEHRLTTHDAVRFAFSHVGKALWVTSAILVAGFSVLTLSDFQFNSDLGLLTAITLVSALALDFLLLPPLLMLIDREPFCTCVTCRCDPARLAEE